jgi:hypothetical protein
VWDGPSWSTLIDVKPQVWQDLLIPFSSLVPVARTRSIPEGQRTPLALDRISAIQVGGWAGGWVGGWVWVRG